MLKTTTPLRVKTKYMTYKKYLRNLFSRRQLDLIYTTLDMAFDLSFVDAYQARSKKDTPQYYTFGTLLQALDNSEAVFQQFPIDERSVKFIARSIFLEEQWLMRDIEIALCDGDLYIVGGRHRLSALVSTFAQLANHLGKDEANKEDFFNEYLAQNVRVDVIHLNDVSDLLKLVMSSNQSRIMRKAEHSHLKVQQLGADSKSASSASRAVLTSDLSPKEARELAAQAFVRRHHDKLKAQTKQVLGEKIAAYIMYGVRPGERLSSKLSVQLKTISEFDDKVNKAWNILNDITSKEVVIARNATALASQVIDRLDAEPYETTQPTEGDVPTETENTAETTENNEETTLRTDVLPMPDDVELEAVAPKSRAKGRKPKVLQQPAEDDTEF